MARCYQCGANLEEGSAFCTWCGANQNKKPTPTPKSTPKKSGIELNLPIDSYFKYMSHDDLYKMALAKWEGVVLKQDQLGAIDILTRLSRLGHIGSLLKLAEICLMDSQTEKMGILLLMKASKLGSDEATDLLIKMGITPKKVIRELPDPQKDVEIPLRDEVPNLDIPYEFEKLGDAILENIVVICWSDSNNKEVMQLGVLTPKGNVATDLRGEQFRTARTLRGFFLVGGREYFRLKIKSISPTNKMVIMSLPEQKKDSRRGVEIETRGTTSSKVHILGVSQGKLVGVEGEYVRDSKKSSTNSDRPTKMVQLKKSTPLRRAMAFDNQGAFLGFVLSREDNKMFVEHPSLFTKLEND